MQNRLACLFAISSVTLVVTLFALRKPNRTDMATKLENLGVYLCYEGEVFDEAKLIDGKRPFSIATLGNFQPQLAQYALFPPAEVPERAFAYLRSFPELRGACFASSKFDDRTWTLLLNLHQLEELDLSTASFAFPHDKRYFDLLSNLQKLKILALPREVNNDFLLDLQINLPNCKVQRESTGTMWTGPTLD